MGCGGSRLEKNEDEVPPTLRPVLRRRLEEFRRLKKGSTLSKKKLLKDAGVEDDHKSVTSSTDESEGSSAKVAPAPLETIEESVREAEEGKEPAKECSDEHAQEREEDVKAAAEQIDGGDGEDDDEEDGIRLSNVEGASVCPGSPSFRVYYTESLERKDDNEHYAVGKDDESREGEIVGSLNSSEVSAPTSIKKKEKKGKKFKRVIPKGKPVKNLLKVKSCYYPACGGHEHSRLIPKKTAAATS